jgi:hypothetical protein
MAGNYFTEGSGRQRIRPANPVGDDGTYLLAIPPPPMVPITSALAQVPTTTTALSTTSSGMKDVVKVIVAIIVAFALLWILDKLLNPRTRAPVRNPARRLSTSELATMLRERLEKRGDANPSVLRALSAYEDRGGRR